MVNPLPPRVQSYEINSYLCSDNETTFNNMRILSITKFIILRFICITAVLLIWLSAGALNLPVKTVRNQEYFYYTVGDDESIYAIANKIGVSPADIVKYNPSLFDGLKPGLVLYFPVEDFGESYGGSSTTIEHIAKKGDTLFSIAGKYGVPTDAIIAMNPGVDKGITVGSKIIVPGGTVMQPVEENPKPALKPEPAPVYAPTQEEDVTITDSDTTYFPESFEQDSVSVATLNIGVCLPFTLNEEPVGKTAQYATDFYRGFLLAVDSLRPLYGDFPLQITAVDCESGQSNQEFRQSLSAFNSSDIIIAPEANNRLDEIGRFGRENNVYVFNTFQSRDTTFLTNPYMMQGNIPAADMYDKVIDYFIDNLNGAVPVFLENSKGKHDKYQFVEQLTARLTAAGKDYRTLSFDGVLTSSTLIEKLPPEDNNYVFVPTGGSPTEFNKFATALSNYKAMLDSEEGNTTIRLFGYPEYTRFTGDAYEKLGKIGTTIYSRFYNDLTSPDTERIAASFTARYGIPLPDGVPNQVLYGFDVARWLLALGSKGEITRNTIEETYLSEGSQMYYRFKPVYDGGFFNDTVIMVTFRENAYPKTEVL